MKFFALAALVATTQAAGTIATGDVCTSDATCKTATDSCCQAYTDSTFYTQKELVCSAKTTANAAATPWVKTGCAGRTVPPSTTPESCTHIAHYSGDQKYVDGCKAK